MFVCRSLRGCHLLGLAVTWPVRQYPAMDADDRAFMHALLLRHEKATDAMIRRLDEGTDAMIRRLDEGTRDMRLRTDAIVRRIDAGTDAITNTLATLTREFVAESRAQREALFRILDRLDGGTAGAGT